MFLAAGALLLVTQSGSVLARFNDRDFCDALKRNVGAYAGQNFGATRVKSAVANCSAKRVQVAFHLNVGAAERQDYINRFLSTARAGICTADPTMETFNKRGWKFEYTFLHPDGTQDVQTLTC